MTSSLFAALSGIRAHQNWIDVVGNNLANASTPGYKAARTTFADSILQTLRFATGPSGNTGGTNPVQIGMGVRMGSIDRNFSQGSLTTTGRIFDLAIDGRGFFTLEDGAARTYTRVGTFGLDADENMVDQRTGLKVVGPDGQPVTVDTHTLFPPNASTEVEFAGNLPAVVTGPLAEVLTGTTGLKEGFPASLTAANGGPTYAVPAGSTWSLEVVVSGGAPQLVTVTDSDSDGQLTNTEIAGALDALDEVSASVSGGLIVMDSDRTGAAVTLRVVPGSPNDLANLINLSTTLVSGSEADVNSGTDINVLPGNVTSYVAGDEIDVVGVDTDGSPVNGTFVYGTNGTTVNDFISFIDGLYADAEASLNASGQIVVEAQTAGEADLLLSIADDSAAVGSTEWSTYAVSVSTDGTGPDQVIASSEIFDPAGVAHTVTFTYERQGDSSWTMTASVPPEVGTVVDGVVTGIAFGEDGTPQGLGSVDKSIAIQFAGQDTAQALELDFGSDGEFDGLTQFGGQTTAFVERQDGYGDGELANLSVDGDGVVHGTYTNGQSRELAAVGIATFTNPEGLHENGDNLWSATRNSGQAVLGSGARPVAGQVIGGTLENSNVDTAEQFVYLIEAQRGFQASARVITTQDEVLAEIVNLI